MKKKLKDDGPSPEELVEALSEKHGGEARTSIRNVPHMLLTSNKVTFSFCWFKKMNRWRVFFPYPSSNQQKRTLKRSEVDAFITKIKKGGE